MCVNVPNIIYINGLIHLMTCSLSSSEEFTHHVTGSFTQLTAKQTWNARSLGSEKKYQMSLSFQYAGSDEDETEDPTRFLQLPKKKTARRSLESQFETCLQNQVEDQKEDDHDEQNKSNTSDLCRENLLKAENLQTNINCDAATQNLTVSQNLFKDPQIFAASSTESIASSVNSRKRTRSPSRTPSFCAAVSASLISIDEEVKKRDVETTVSKTSKPKPKAKNSATPKSITSLPPSPHVPNQTSTPATNQIITISASHNTIDSDTALCRICHDGDNSEGLVSPCYCSGSVGALHMTCLERWLGASNTTKCEICKYEFKVERKPRPLMEFLRHPASQADRKNLVCDMVCFVVLTPLTICSTFLCLMGVKHYSQWSGPRWEVPGLASLTACLLTIYGIWCCVAAKHHLDVLRDWRKKNQIIKIIYLSPTKGKTVLRTQTVKDDNNNNVVQSPARNLGCHTLGTPTALTSLCGALHSRDSASRSYDAAMLRPILRYSVNLQTYSHPSEFESPGSLSHTVIWGPDQSDFDSNPLLFTHASGSQMMSVFGKETYV